MSYADFDRYCDEKGVPEGDGLATAEAFGQWMADLTGSAIIGGPVGEPPSIVALPSDV